MAARTGLAYTSPVTVDLLPRDAFEARLLEVGLGEPAQMAAQQASLVALGLLPPGPTCAPSSRRCSPAG